jgi:hypothetical protein
MILILLIWVGFVKLVKINQLGRIYWHMKIGPLFVHCGFYYLCAPDYQSV